MAVLDPLAIYSFGVEITGVTIAQFKEVSGLGMVVSVIEHRANQIGGQPVLQKLPGSVHYDDIHLSRGKVSDPAFWAWISRYVREPEHARPVAIPQRADSAQSLLVDARF